VDEKSRQNKGYSAVQIGQAMATKRLRAMGISLEAFEWEIYLRARTLTVGEVPELPLLS
jgi:hypothetical protein